MNESIIYSLKKVVRISKASSLRFVASWLLVFSSAPSPFYLQKIEHSRSFYILFKSVYLDRKKINVVTLWLIANNIIFLIYSYWPFTKLLWDIKVELLFVTNISYFWQKIPVLSFCTDSDFKYLNLKQFFFENWNTSIFLSMWKS